MSEIGATTRPVATPDRLDGPFADPLASSLFGPLATGAHWGIDRVFRALAALGDPHLACPVVHVGGTNGKGSVAMTVAAVLSAAGRRTACYTSPHLCSVRERMLIDQQPFGEKALLDLADEAGAAVNDHGLTFFEAMTTLAFLAFARAGAEAAVVEVGLGGRLDATNVVQPEVAAITNIALDHAEYLGGSLESIAAEKAGIVKAGAPLATAEHRPEILSLFREAAEAVGAPFAPLDPYSLSPVAVRMDGTSFAMDTDSWGELELVSPLVGRHQATNAALAVRVLDMLPENMRPDGASVRRGVRKVEYHGRNQVERLNQTTWLFDGAHNTAGMATLADTIARLDLPRPLVALIGVLGDKDWFAMLGQILALTDAAVLTQPPSAAPARRWSITEARARLGELTPISVTEDFNTALALAAADAGTGTVIVCGSIYTVGSALSVLGLEPLAGR